MTERLDPGLSSHGNQALCPLAIDEGPRRQGVPERRSDRAQHDIDIRNRTEKIRWIEEVLDDDLVSSRPSQVTFRFGRACQPTYGVHPRSQQS